MVGSRSEATFVINISALFYVVSNPYNLYFEIEITKISQRRDEDEDVDVIFRLF